MLILSDASVSALKGQAVVGFDKRAFEFLWKEFPELVRLRDAQDVHRAIVAGQNRASLSGCRTEQEVILYISLQFILGTEFDSDPDLAEVGAIMNQFDVPAITRLDQVFDNIDNYSR